MSEQQTKNHQNIVIQLRGNCEQFERLLELFESKELEKILGIPILELEAFSFKKNITKQEPISPPLNLERQVSNLSQWFKGIFESRWKEPQDLEYLSQMLPGFRNFTNHSAGTIIQRYLVINRSMLIQDFIVLLVIKLERIKTEIKADVVLFGDNNKKVLPPGIILRLCSQGECKKQVEAREADNCIPLPRFKVQPGDQFSIEVVLADVSFVEEFVA